MARAAFVVSDESDLVAALRALANVPDGSTFRLQWKGTAFVIEYSGGSSSSLALSTSYDAATRTPKPEEPRPAAYRDSAKRAKLVAIRPMNIQLRPETSGDVMDKEAQVSREWQSGDRGFDNEVYVDTPTTADDVLAAVLCDPVRDGARKLLELGLKRVVIDDELGRVVVSMTEFSRPGDQSVRAKEICDAFALLLSGLPAIERSTEQHPGKPMGATMMVGGVLACILGFGLPAWFFAVAGALDCTEAAADGEGSNLKDGCGSSAVLGAVVGFAAAFTAVMLVRGPLKRALSGRSDSGARLTKGLLIAGVVTFVAVFLSTAGIVMSKR